MQTTGFVCGEVNKIEWAGVLLATTVYQCRRCSPLQHAQSIWEATTTKWRKEGRRGSNDGSEHITRHTRRAARVAIPQRDLASLAFRLPLPAIVRCVVRLLGAAAERQTHTYRRQKQNGKKSATPIQRMEK